MFQSMQKMNIKIQMEREEEVKILINFIFNDFMILKEEKKENKRKGKERKVTFRK